MSLLWKALRAWAPMLVLSTAAGVQVGVAPQSGPADEAAAFRTARTERDPAQRTAALQRYLLRFPASVHHAVAEQLLLTAMLDTLPTPTADLRVLANALVLEAPAGIERWMEEARLASLLADAGQNGADLNDAARWSSDALQAVTEPAYARQMVRIQSRYKLPALTSGQLRRQFALDRATVLTAAAAVNLRTGRLPPAETELRDALRRSPLSAPATRLQAELLSNLGRRPEALAAFLRADALQPLPPRWRAVEEQLFAEQHGGEPGTLDAHVDAVAAGLYPPVFRLPARHLAPGGHPALLELYTGSDCLPCVGPDLAVDSLLGSYSRSDLVVLEMDEHIPRPDPLATPETVDRGESYGVEATPALFLDGRSLPVLGTTRADVTNLVVSLGDAIEAQAALRSGLRLAVTVARDGQGALEIRPSLSLDPRSPTSPDDTTGDFSLRSLQNAVVHLALVEDPLRYAGANGVRTHRMVVRALRQLPAASLLVASPQPVVVHLQPQDIGRELTAYLQRFETDNDTFGAFQFPRTDFPLQEDRLAVVAWVETPTNHGVLQTVFAAIPER